jgi:hypothetical protein
MFQHYRLPAPWSTRPNTRRQRRQQYPRRRRRRRQHDGGKGGDTYYVDNVGDKTVELATV